jgi:hypothetical protein
MANDWLNSTAPSEFAIQVASACSENLHIRGMMRFPAKSFVHKCLSWSNGLESPPVYSVHRPCITVANAMRNFRSECVHSIYCHFGANSLFCKGNLKIETDTGGNRKLKLFLSVVGVGKLGKTPSAIVNKVGELNTFVPFILI